MSECNTQLIVNTNSLRNLTYDPLIADQARRLQQQFLQNNQYPIL